MNLNDYQNAALETAVYPGQGTALGLIYCALKGAGEAGEFAEHVGKAIRDDDFVPIGTFTPNDGTPPERLANLDQMLSPNRLDKLIAECGDQLWYIAAKARELGVTLEEVAEVNLRKLRRRAEEGTLQGSGDDR